MTPDQTKALNCASLAAIIAAGLHLTVFPKKGKGVDASALTKSGAGGAAAGAAAYFGYDKLPADTLAKIEPYLVPAGAGAAAFLLADILKNKGVLNALAGAKNASLLTFGAAALAAGGTYYVQKKQLEAAPSVAGYFGSP